MYTLEDYRYELRSHDWYYAMSDDHSVWRRGVEHQELLSQIYNDLANRGYAGEADIIRHEVMVEMGMV